ncbi:unnamed protein product, partial [Phaeothamnion confervicola]
EERQLDREPKSRHWLRKVSLGSRNRAVKGAWSAREAPLLLDFCDGQYCWIDLFGSAVVPAIYLRGLDVLQATCGGIMSFIKSPSGRSGPQHRHGRGGQQDAARRGSSVGEESGDDRRGGFGAAGGSGSSGSSLLAAIGGADGTRHSGSDGCRGAGSVGSTGNGNGGGKSDGILASLRCAVAAAVAVARRCGGGSGGEGEILKWTCLLLLACAGWVYVLTSTFGGGGGGGPPPLGAASGGPPPLGAASGGTIVSSGLPQVLRRGGIGSGGGGDGADDGSARKTAPPALGDDAEPAFPREVMFAAPPHAPRRTVEIPPLDPGRTAAVAV